MTVFDYVVLAVVGASVLLSVIRGALKEVMALVAWVAAFFVGNLYADRLEPLLPASIPTPELRFVAAFVALFLVTLVVLTLVSVLLSELVKAVGLSPLDRGLGALFGLLRGLLIVLVAVLLAGLTSVPREKFWRNAMFSAPLEALAVAVRPYLPGEMAKRIKYD